MAFRTMKISVRDALGVPAAAMLTVVEEILRNKN
jgi:hypothetical protein